MDSDYEQEQLWALLGEEAEAGEPSVPPRVAGLSQQPGFGDRLAKRLASGVLPLFLAGLLPALFSAALNDWLGIFFALLMLALLSWIISPLVRGSGFTSALRLALLFFPMGICVATFGLLPVPLVRGKVEDTAYFYQMALTTLLDRPGWAILLGVLIFVGLPAYYSRRSFSWVRVQPARPARKLLALVLLLAPYLIYGAMWIESAPSKEILTWKARVEASLPLTPSSAAGEWYDLYSKSNLIALDAKEKQPQELRHLARQVIAQAKLGLPSSMREAEYVAQAVLGLLKTESLHLSEDERADLEYLFAHCVLLSRPSLSSGGGVVVLPHNIIPRVLTTPDIPRWRSRILALEGLLCKSTIEELDQNAWLYLYAQPIPEPEIFGTVQGAPKRRKVYLNPTAQLKQRPARIADPIDIFGFKLDGSPTQLEARRFQKSQIGRWFRIKSQLVLAAPGEPLKELKRLATEDDPLFPRSNLLESLKDRAFRDYSLPWLQTAGLILDLREQKSPHLTSEQARRWSLQKVEDGWRLSLKDSPYHLGDSWVIR